MGCDSGLIFSQQSPAASSGGGGGGTPVRNELPFGAINGINTAFTLVHVPLVGTAQVYLVGVRMRPGSGNDYTITGNTLTFEAGQIPQTGAWILVDYEY